MITTKSDKEEAAKVALGIVAKPLVRLALLHRTKKIHHHLSAIAHVQRKRHALRTGFAEAIKKTPMV